jgi:hypothetical protein
VLQTSHWAEEGDSRRSRLLRVELVNRILAHVGLRLDDWSGSVYVLRDRKGSARVVADVGTLWVAAEELAGQPLDPLDPELLATLRA